jgi:hypothetical protein
MIIYVAIKYDQSEISNLASMLQNVYNVTCDVTVVRTDEHEWPYWREFYEADDEYEDGESKADH